MKIFDVDISHQVFDFFIEYLNDISSYESANLKIFNTCGIIQFFENDSDLQILLKSVSTADTNLVAEPDRAEYGDFQTNTDLANKIAKQLHLKTIAPEILIEPTCGKGNFIIASLINYTSLKKVFGIEIYKPYIWETKFNILDYFLSNPGSKKPEIIINHSSIFDFDFEQISKQFPTEPLLIIGNPPWVTNSKLGSLNSTNLPKKSNFKNQNGLDAITGKGNFDIAEYITIMLLETFEKHNGYLSLLVKNSVIKNLLFDQKTKHFRISEIEKYCIDSKKEFNVSVEASLLLCRLNSTPDFKCTEYDFYSLKKKSSFGWIKSKFVSNISDYNEIEEIDGICPFEWRQGIKHDCAPIMELEKAEDQFINNRGEKIILEDDLIYGFLKSSDLKNTVIEKTRKHIIVTQTKVGQETAYIRQKYPLTYTYLKNNIENFNARKSSIYKGKPLFSIFGIGDYSFKPFKVAISGLYKTYHFTLVLPQNGKPVMLDDTCYFIGFNKIEFAVYSIILLNSGVTEEFLKSISFSDAKRVFTKDLLMRLDLLKLSLTISTQEIEFQLDILNEKYGIHVNLSQWDSYLDEMKPINKKQLTMF